MISTSSIRMFTKSPLFLSFLVFASILVAAQSQDELRTGVPYYMSPYIWAIGGGVTPLRLRNEKCPSAVRFTFETDPGVPITFSTSPYDDGESVVIDEKTDVYISFNVSVCEERKTWGYRFSSPLPSRVNLELVSAARIYVHAKFRIKREGEYYRVFSPQIVDSEGNIRDYYPVKFRRGTRLLLRSDIENPTLFIFSKAEDYEGRIKSVV